MKKKNLPPINKWKMKILIKNRTKYMKSMEQYGKYLKKNKKLANCADETLVFCFTRKQCKMQRCSVYVVVVVLVFTHRQTSVTTYQNREYSIWRVQFDSRFVYIFYWVRWWACFIFVRQIFPYKTMEINQSDHK